MKRHKTLNYWTVNARRTNSNDSLVTHDRHYREPWARVTGSRLTYPVADVQSRQSGCLRTDEGGGS